MKTSVNKFYVDGKTASLLMWLSVFFICIMFMVFNPFYKSVTNLWLGAVVLVFSLQPMGKWLISARKIGIPILELHLVFYAVCFGVAAFVTPNIMKIRLEEEDFSIALLATLLCILMVRFGYICSQLGGAKVLAALVPKFENGKNQFVLLFVYPVTVLLLLVTQAIKFESFFQPLASIRQFSFILVVCAAFGGNLRPWLRLAVFVFVVPIDFLLFSGIRDGFLAGLLFYGEVLFVVIVFYKRTIPVWIFIAVIGLFFLMQPGKDAYRRVTWGDRPSLSFTQKIDLYFDSAMKNFSVSGDLAQSIERLNGSYDRLNQLYTTGSAMSVVRYQDRLLYGETYMPLLTSWVPRVVWPDKPRQDIGNSWGRLYGLLDDNDYDTSYNLVWLPEMFINFGWVGICLISIAVGWLIGALRRGVASSAKSPAEVAFALTISSVFFWPESNLSLQLGGCIISWISIYCLTFGLRFLNVGDARRH